MGRLTKSEIKAHREAEAFLEKDVLTLDEREFVFNNWQAGARHINSAAGAFFTPLTLAFDFAIEVGGSAATRVIDLCAGIGVLSYAVSIRNPKCQIVCVEKNPDYVAIGRKLVPEATWIEASVDSLPHLGHFDFTIGNPPFGKTAKVAGPRYRGEDDLAVVDIASDLSDWGVFIVPQMSAPFIYSGATHYQLRTSAKYDRFRKATGIELNAGCGIDCAFYRDGWRGVSPEVEIVVADFEEARAMRAPEQASLMLEAAA